MRAALESGSADAGWRVPLEVVLFRGVTDENRGLFWPYMKEGLQLPVFVALLAVCEDATRPVGDAGRAREPFDLTEAGAILAFLNGLYDNGVADVTEDRVRRFCNLFSTLGAHFSEAADADVDAFRDWLASRDFPQLCRSETFPRPQLLSRKELTELADALYRDVFFRYCTCRAPLGQTEDEWTLVACDADGGCSEHHWYHRECGGIVDIGERAFCLKDKPGPGQGGVAATAATAEPVATPATPAPPAGRASQRKKKR